MSQSSKFQLVCDPEVFRVSPGRLGRVSMIAALARGYSMAVAAVRRPMVFASLLSAFLVAVGMCGFSLSASYWIIRERIFDQWLPVPASGGAATGVVVVDIDRDAIARHGAWPWSRLQMANLVERIAIGKPRLVAIDVLFEGADLRSPAALARQLAEATRDARRAADAEGLPDGDKLLAKALAKRPAVLSLLLDPTTERASSYQYSVLSMGPKILDDVWSAPGVVEPLPLLWSQAAGLGMSALAADLDGRIRRAPLLVQVQGRLVPGFATEILRVRAGASNLIVREYPNRLLVGGATIPLADNATLRLLPFASVTAVPASELLRENADERVLEGKTVILGSSAPEAGGLRLAASGDLMPSLHLHALVVQQALAGVFVSRPAFFGALERGCALLAVVLATWIGWQMRPLAGALVAGTLSISWAVTSFFLARHMAVTLDPVLVPVSLNFAFSVAALFSAASSWAQAQRLRQRFEQHLAPAVVRKLVAEPDLVRFEGELRDITVLFTDIEGFSSMVDRGDARSVVRELDRYIDAVSAIVIEHGGMVEKVVGDAVHALFNAPLDLPNHQQHAIACAQAIISVTDALRARPEIAGMGFGRTRIGIETGRLIVGDVGGSRKLDYTAHGRAINLAARLEQANKDFVSSICIGSETAAAFAFGHLRPLGSLLPRGYVTPIEVYEPWPEVYTSADRDLFLEAHAAEGRDSRHARDCLLKLSKAHPGDLVLQRRLERLRSPTVFD